jgi:hypothetical protein
MLSGKRLSSAVARNSVSSHAPWIDRARLRLQHEGATLSLPLARTRPSSGSFVSSSSSAIWHQPRLLHLRDSVTKTCQVPPLSASTPTARAGGSRHGRCHRLADRLRAFDQQPPVGKSAGCGQQVVERPPRVAAQLQRGGAELARHCAAGWRSPCRPRCPPRRSPAGSGRPREGPAAPSPRHRRWRGSRPRSPRCLREGLRDLGQPRLGVAHGRGVIAVDVAEIALALDQRVARGEILRLAHQRLVDRAVAVRVVLCPSRRRRCGRTS